CLRWRQLAVGTPATQPGVYRLPGNHAALGSRLHGLQGLVPAGLLLLLALQKLPNCLINHPAFTAMKLVSHRLKAAFDIGLESDSCNAHGVASIRTNASYYMAFSCGKKSWAGDQSPM